MRRKKLSKLLAVFLALVMILLEVPTPVRAAGDEQTREESYVIYDDNLAMYDDWVNLLAGENITADSWFDSIKIVLKDATVVSKTPDTLDAREYTVVLDASTDPNAVLDLEAVTEDAPVVQEMNAAFGMATYTSAQFYPATVQLQNGKASVSVYPDLFNDQGDNKRSGYQNDEIKINFEIAEPAPEPTTVSVNYTSQMSGGFLHAPQFNAEVASDLAESYGYTDQVTDGVSALDVLVAAHELVLGEDFTAETAQNYLTISSAGSPNSQFGIGSSEAYGGFFLNHCLANDGTKYDENNYNGTTVATQEVKDGDWVEFFFYEDESYGDTYNWFLDSDDAYSREFTVEEDTDLDLTLMGFFAMNSSLFKDEAEMTSSDRASEQGDVQIYTVNTETGALTAITGAVTDEDDGTVTLNFAEPGEYWITGYGTDDCMWTQIMSLTKVKVTAAAAESHIAVTEPAQIETETGKMETIDLAEYFTDTEGHELSYVLSGEHGEHTKISDGKLYFSEASEGTYELTVTATCGAGDTAVAVFTFVVEKAAGSGDTYDQTPAESVTIRIGSPSMVFRSRAMTRTAR